jgi:ABC-type phosphate/phosphonate transport system substrate-binding protein
MAYVSQERKQSLAPAIKAVLKKYGVKGSLSIRTHSSLVLTVKSGKIDFVENFIETDSKVLHGRKMSQDQIDHIRKNQSVDVNPYWYHEHFSGKAKDFLKEVLAAMNKGNHNNSDAMTDYFDVGWYVDVNIGRWNQPYVYVA